MKAYYLLAFVLLVSVGCGDTSTPTVDSDQDELAAWVAANPVDESEQTLSDDLEDQQ